MDYNGCGRISFSNRWRKKSVSFHKECPFAPPCNIVYFEKWAKSLYAVCNLPLQPWNKIQRAAIQAVCVCMCVCVCVWERERERKCVYACVPVFGKLHVVCVYGYSTHSCNVCIGNSSQPETEGDCAAYCTGWRSLRLLEINSAKWHVACRSL